MTKQVFPDDEFYFVRQTHLLIGLWYKDTTVLKWAIPDAERFLGRRKTTLLEKGMVSFLLDLVSGNMDKASEDLLVVCKGYPKDQKYVLGSRPFCTFAHGLNCLAQLLLPEDAFQHLKLPEYKNFLPGFALWRREHPNPDRSLWFRYPEDMSLFDEFYAAPPAKLILKAPQPDDKKQEWFAYGMKWLDSYVDEIWDMGIGQE